MTVFLPDGWEMWQLLGLEETFRGNLLPLLHEAALAGLRPRYRSGPRTNTAQAALRSEFERKRELFAKGKITTPPLPAAFPGASSHNWAICVYKAEHRIGLGAMCAECGNSLVPQSLAVDVMLLDVNDKAIHSGGAVALDKRPAEWREWARLVGQHPLLRDGGTFSRPDPVHVESVFWDFHTKRLRAA